MINLQRAVFGPSATLTDRERPAIDLCRILTWYRDEEQTTTKEDGKLTSENKAERQLNNSYTHPNCVYITIGIKHGFNALTFARSRGRCWNMVFQCINIRQVPWEVLKTEAFGLGFQHLPLDLANVNAWTFARSLGRCWKPRPSLLMHWKNMFDRYYCIKTENIRYTLSYFLHYFVSPFHRCLANVISTDDARSMAGQYTCRYGSNSVAPVRVSWKLRSRALTARELPC